MFDKIIHIKIDPTQTKVLDSEILKTASESILPPGHKYDPDFVYIMVRSVSAGEYWGPNNNVDFFEEAELKSGYNTFLTDANVFKNHENKLVEKSIGKVVSAEFDEFMKCVILVIRIDKKLAPEITRGFLTGSITDVSMGCRVGHVICSYCGKRAKTRAEYCNHLSDQSTRGKVMPNGVQVYEINKSPVFHDISVVTRGADRTAKAYQVVDGEKAARDETLKKVASLNFEERVAGVPLTQKFFPQYKADPYLDLGFKKQAGTPMMKLAEIEKIIKGNIISVLNEEQNEQAVEGIDEIFEAVRMFYTQYWDENATSEIVSKINAIARDRHKTPEHVFKTFLRTAELAGIELTPLEFSRIKSRIDGIDSSVIEDLSKQTAERMPTDNFRVVMRQCRNSGSDAGGMFAGQDPLLENNIFSNILRPFMQGRSSRSEHLGNRIIKIISEDSPMIGGNMSQFMPSFLKQMPGDFEGKTIVIKLASEYDAYQNDRVNLYSSDDFEKEAALIDDVLLKMAFTKEAVSGSFLGYSALAIPTAYGYSAYQRAKMLNGEPISGFNRYVAENPGNAAAMTVLGPIISKRVKRRVMNDLSDSATNVKRVAKHVGEKASKAVDATGEVVAQNKKFNSKKILDKSLYEVPESRFKKQASENLSPINLFDNGKINDGMLKKGYSTSQISAVKLAMAYQAMDEEPLASDVLKAQNIYTDEPIEDYLKMALELVTIELEKLAGEALDIARDTFADTLFYPKGVGVGSLLPGSAVDGFIFNKITKSLEKKTQKDLKKNVSPNLKEELNNEQLV